MHQSFASLLLSLFVVATSFGQDKQLDRKLNEMLTRQFKPTEPGCDILVSKHGQTLYKKVVGSADL